MFDGIARGYRAVLAVAQALMGRLPELEYSPRFKYAQPARRIVRRSSFGGRRGIKRYAGEMARRVRQINRGQLTPSNGLITEMNRQIKVNSHGKIHTFCRPCQRLVNMPDGPGECDFPNCADVWPNGCAA